MPLDSQPAPVPCSVIIPAKNEAPSIGAVIAGALDWSGEVIVVDGHSTDATAQVARELGAFVVRDQGVGKGAAMRTGAANARENILLFMDADGSHDPQDIPRLVAPILAGAADLVIGSRMTGGSDELSGTLDRFIRLAVSQFITLTINWRWKTQLTDSQNGFRAIRKTCFMQLELKENSYAIEQEMLMKALKAKLRVAEVPAHEYARRHGRSHVRLRRVWRRQVWSWLKEIV